MITTWGFPTTIRFGVGAASTVGAELSDLGVASALIVTDRGVRDAGLLTPVLSSLKEGGVAAAVFDGVDGNPTEANVDAGHEAYVAAKAESVVAVGGGSPMDAAKVIALRANHHEPLATYDDAQGGDRHVTEAVPPIIAIPTTAGTGSEVGRSGVVTLEATGRKTIIFAPTLLPRVALLDPQLTASMPAKVTAATGYDALTHCVEALAAKGDHPMADGIALRGIALVARALARVLEQPDDLDARGDMMKAAMMGAVAFQKGLGACHSLAHPLSAVCGLHHGLANALCLPAVVAFNLEVAADAYAEVDRILGGTGDAGRCAERLADLRASLGLPGGLKAAGIATIPFDELADEAFLDVCHQSNPRPCTRDNLLGLYRACA